jgi:1-acyl-sn-glycerol-3-phosphate acyltransferase
VLDLARLERIRLTRIPRLQQFVGHILSVNYGVLPGVRIDLEGWDGVPRGPVIFAMNHTDRYNYFPFQHQIWKRYGRFTATWVKGKYYEHSFVGNFMEMTNQLPTVSRGYLITKDFHGALGREPSNEEYGALRRWVDAAAAGDRKGSRPSAGSVPDALLTTPRDVLGRPFDPEKEDYASYIDALFHEMMRRFVELNQKAVGLGLDLLIFPQGTRSVRLLPGHIGISQMALHLKLPIVPVGCNGSDQAYPSGSPWAKKAEIVYRFGDPIPYEDIAELHPDGDYEPFSTDAEERYGEQFEGLAALVTDRIEGLLDERHRRAHGAGEEATEGARRFV